MRSAKRCTPRPSRRFSSAYNSKMCSDLSKHHCLFCLHMVWTTTLFLLPFSRAHGCLRDFLLDVPVFWACALPLLSFVATKKPLTRWRLTFVQEAARGISPSSAFFLKDVEVPDQILQKTCEESFFKSFVFHTLHFSVC